MHVTKFGKAALGAEFRVAPSRPQRGCNLPGSGSWAHWRSRLPAGATARGQPRLELETAGRGRPSSAALGSPTVRTSMEVPGPLSSGPADTDIDEGPWSRQGRVAELRPWCQTRLHGPEPFLADMHNLAGTALCATVVKPSTVHLAAKLGCPSWGSARRWQTSAAVRKAQAC